jgi:protein TonB
MLSIRVPIALMAGALSSVVIFLVLSQLVSVQFDIPPHEDAVEIEFTRKIVESPVDPTPPVTIDVVRPPVRVIQPHGPTVSSGPIEPLPLGPSTVMGLPRKGLPIGIDKDVTPLVRINPDYPPRAAANGTQGWAQVRFTVTTAGTVRDAVVVASEPGEVFDQAALDAVARWRYNPRVDSGAAVERVGLETVFRFELEN